MSTHKKKSNLILLEVDAAFCKATREQGLDGWLSFFGPDALVFTARGKIVAGLEAIREWYTSIAFPPDGFSWKPERGELASSGDLGYTAGRWSIEGDAKSSKEKQQGRYLSVWRKLPEGGWKIQADCGGMVDIRTRYKGLAEPPRRIVRHALRCGKARSNDIAWQAGNWSAAGIRDPGHTSTFEGKFLAVWRRRRDGSWKLDAEVGFPHR